MDVVKGCMICGKLSVASCKLCGKLVCKDHMDSEKGICTNCKQGPM